MPPTIQIKRYPITRYMETKEEILGLVARYIERFPDQKEEAAPLINFLHEHKGYDLINRKNFNGHITTSGFIVNENNDALLLLKHKFLGRWLQPGGHVDSTDLTLMASALREACEETGLFEHQLLAMSNSIFDIDSHQIPANQKKEELAHVHHDLRFLFKCIDSATINISKEESTDSKWVPFSDLEEDQDFGNVVKKIQQLTA